MSETSQLVWGLFGGLGGATLTALVAIWKARQEKPSIFLCERLLSFKLPFSHDDRISVTFLGHSYQRLRYYEVAVINIGQVEASSGLLHVAFENSHVLTVYTAASPENVERRVRRDSQLPRHKLLLEFDGLLPNDSVRFGFLVDGGSRPQVEFRSKARFRVKKRLLAFHTGSTQKPRFPPAIVALRDIFPVLGLIAVLLSFWLFPDFFLSTLPPDASPYEVKLKETVLTILPWGWGTLVGPCALLYWSSFTRRREELYLTGLPLLVSEAKVFRTETNWSLDETGTE